MFPYLLIIRAYIECASIEKNITSEKLFHRCYTRTLFMHLIQNFIIIVYALNAIELNYVSTADSIVHTLWL
jgi:hypothetical protein